MALRMYSLSSSLEFRQKRKDLDKGKYRDQILEMEMNYSLMNMR